MFGVRMLILNIKTEDGRWSESKVNLEELTKADFLAAFQRSANRSDLANRPLEFYRLVQHIILNSNDDKDITKLVNEFGYKVINHLYTEQKM